jgi:hypothetical protein
MFTLLCDIFIMCFVLFLFVTCFGWNFNVMAAAAEKGGSCGGEEWRRVAVVAEEEEEEEGGGGLFVCNYD